MMTHNSRYHRRRPCCWHRLCGDRCHHWWKIRRPGDGAGAVDWCGVDWCDTSLLHLRHRRAAWSSTSGGTCLRLIMKRVPGAGYALHDHVGWVAQEKKFSLNYAADATPSIWAPWHTRFENLAPKYMYQLISVNFFLVLISTINHVLFLSKPVLLPVSGISKI